MSDEYYSGLKRTWKQAGDLVEVNKIIGGDPSILNELVKKLNSAWKARNADPRIGVATYAIANYCKSRDRDRWTWTPADMLKHWGIADQFVEVVSTEERFYIEPLAVKTRSMESSPELQTDRRLPQRSPDSVIREIAPTPDNEPKVIKAIRSESDEKNNSD